MTDDDIRAACRRHGAAAIYALAARALTDRTARAQMAALGLPARNVAGCDRIMACAFGIMSDEQRAADLAGAAIALARLSSRPVR